MRVALLWTRNQEIYYGRASRRILRSPEAVHGWANKIVLQLAKNTPDDHVLVECIEKTHAGPYGPRGMIRSLVAALEVYDAYHNGLVPPNLGHPIVEKKDDEDRFG